MIIQFRFVGTAGFIRKRHSAFFTFCHNSPLGYIKIDKILYGIKIKIAHKGKLILSRQEDDFALRRLIPVFSQIGPNSIRRQAQII